MQFNPLTRRAFLRGAGGSALAIPLLPSLLTKTASAAGVAPMRFAFMYYNYGNAMTWWWPGIAKSTDTEYPTTPSADGSYRSRALSDIPGDMSGILGPWFDVSIRKKMAVVRGLDPLGRPHAHSSTYVLTGDGGYLAGRGVPLQFGISADIVMEGSRSFYPTPQALGALRTSPDLSSKFGGSWSWMTVKGVNQNKPVEWSPQAVYAKVFTGGMPPMNGGVSPGIARLKDLTSDVNQDYKDTLASRRISADDKIRLDNFMSLVAQIRTKLDAPVVSCTPNKAIEAQFGTIDDYGKLHSVMMDMEVAALACGTTKIVTHGLVNSYGPSRSDTNPEEHHAMGHEGGERAYKRSKWMAGLFAEFIKKLDAVTESDGRTLLDNTVVLYTSEDATGSHFQMDLPILLAGGKGKIKTDLYVDYRNLNTPMTQPAMFATGSGGLGGKKAYFGRPHNNLLITILKACGLTQADYTVLPGQDGFGPYEPYGHDYGGKGGFYDKYVKTSAARNEALPGLYLG